MRLAGDDDIFDEIQSSSSNKLDKYFEAYQILKSKGLSEETADATAIRMAQGLEPMVKPTLRFALIYGDESNSTTESD